MHTLTHTLSHILYTLHILTQVFDYVERPQIAQDKDGKPLALFVGHGYSGVHNLAMVFCQAGDSDADCVTAVQ
jgi:hypothetical protein